MKQQNAKSLESWIWDAACSIRGAKDAPKYKDYIFPKRLGLVTVAASGGSGDAGTNTEKTVRQWFVDYAELTKNDCNISHMRYIHTSDAGTYRPLSEIVEESDTIGGETRETDKALREILEKIEV